MLLEEGVIAVVLDGEQGGDVSAGCSLVLFLLCFLFSFSLSVIVYGAELFVNRATVFDGQQYALRVVPLGCLLSKVDHCLSMA